MAIPVSTIIESIFKSIPGLLKLISSFSRTEEPTQDEINKKAESEIEALEEWKSHAKKEAAE